MTGRPARVRSLRLTAAAAAGWALVVTGAGHAALLAISTAGKPTPAEHAVRAPMEAVTMTMSGLDRNFWQLFNGFSLAMALALVGFGAVTLLVLRQAPQLLQRTRALLWLDAAVVLPLLAVSVLLLPPPPIALLSFAAAAIGTALGRPNSAPSPVSA